MPPRTRIETLQLVARVLIGAGFFYLGGEKLFRIDSFVADVGNYQLVAAPWDAVVAYAVAWLELVVGFLLMLGWLRCGALVVLGGLLVAFMAGIAQAWARGLSISCGCFGASAEPTNYPLHLGGNLLLLAVVGWLGWSGRGSRHGGA